MNSPPSKPSVMLTADELLAGSALTFDVEVPASMLLGGRGESGHVRLRPLTVRDLQLIGRAAKDNDALAAALMVQTALVEPQLTLAQVNALQVGLLQKLLDEVNHISGIGATEAQLRGATEDPLVRAAFLLSSEFGWTPEQVGELTLAQVLMHLQMLKEKRGEHD
tara:strand:+ start:2158 stop:2652 length:495 start_codon:yes stop_codon:yes gene_type:complete